MITFLQRGVRKEPGLIQGIFQGEYGEGPLVMVRVVGRAAPFGFPQDHDHAHVRVSSVAPPSTSQPARLHRQVTVGLGILITLFLIIFGRMWINYYTGYKCAAGCFIADTQF